MSPAGSSPFGSVLKQYRLAAGLSQEELAAHAGLSPHGISDLERGARRTPRPSTLRLLADALGLSADARAAFVRAASVASRVSPELDTNHRDTSTGTAPSLVPPEQAKHNLSLQPTELLGREREVESIAALLRREDLRLVTVTGPGGVGKTRLGLEVASGLTDAFPDGVWFVPLSRLTDAASVLQAIARAVGVHERDGAHSLSESLHAYLNRRRALLLLDNFEHLLTAATDVAAVLAACPDVKVLVTSRAPLHLRGEHEYALSPLAVAPDLDYLPSSEQVAEYPAISLFVERAQAARASFRLTTGNAAAVAALCAQLDGLPLAIELAAARVKLLDPHALLAQLAQTNRRDVLLGRGPRDLEERQQTLRRTLDWSYELLSTEERCLFRRLSVFVGGWTLEAAEAICSAPSGMQPPGMDVVEGLGRLLDHSLIRRQPEGTDGPVGEGAGPPEPRFTMLHVIREYGYWRLETSGEPGETQAVRSAHATYFAERARAAGKAALALSGYTEGHWGAWLIRERDNLAAALSWLTESHEMSQAIWVGAALAHTDIVFGLYTGARQRLGRLLDASAPEGNAMDPEARLLALSRAAILASAQDDLARTTELRQEQVALARRLGHPRYMAQALAALALLAVDRGVPDDAVRHGEEAVDLARQDGDLATLAFALENLGVARFARGDLQQAQSVAEEGLALSRRTGFLWAQGINAGVLALVRCRRDDPMGALRMMHESATVLREHGGLHGITGVLLIVACAWAIAGDGYRSARMMGAAYAAMAHAKGVPEPALVRFAQDMTAPTRAALGEERWQQAVKAGRELPLEDAFAEAFAGVDDG